MGERRNQIFDYEPLVRSKAKELGDDEWFESKGTIKNAATVEHTASPNRQPEESKTKTKDDKNWLIRRGHFLSYVGLLFFTIVVYLRPYEIVPALAPFTKMALWVAIITLVVFVPAQLAVEGKLAGGPREVKLLLLLGFCALLSIPLGDDPATSWDAFIEFVKVIIIFIVMVNSLRTEKRLTGLIFLLLGIGCYVCALTLRNYLSGNFEYEGYRVGGIGVSMLQNPNDVALYFVTMVPLALGMLLATRKRYVKFLCGVAAILMLGGILITYSRAGLVGLFFVISVLVWRGGRQRRLAAFILAGAIGVFVLTFAPTGIGSRFSTILDNQGSASLRRNELRRSIVIALRHPLLGIGMGNYLSRSTYNQASHNAYTQVASEIGIPAMVVYIMLLLSPLKRLRRLENETSGADVGFRFHYLAIGMQASLIGYMVCSFFASVAFQWYAYYLVAVGVCLSRVYLVKRRAEHQTGDNESIQNLSNARLSFAQKNRRYDTAQRRISHT